MNLKLLLFVPCQFFFLQLEAQQKGITGKVVDGQTQQAMAGVTVMIEGSGKQTKTDATGSFVINENQQQASLLFSFVGYENQKLLYQGQPLKVMMKAANRDLDEVVVVGYGTQRKKDLTGAIKSIGSEDIEGRRTVQISESLQGSIGGVSVTRSSGAPGSGANILIRGITTIGTNSPLIIVDGSPVNSIDHINPMDVENLTVLKDAASAAIYGSRGAAGVILITTKRAKAGQQSLDYAYELGVQEITASPKYVGIQDYMRYFNEQLTNDGGAALYAQEHIENYLTNNAENPDEFPNTDWQKAVMTNKNPLRNRHELVFTSGNDRIKTKASMGYTKQGAFYDNYDYERLLMRVNNDLKISDKFNLNLDLGYKRTNTNELPYNVIYRGRTLPAFYDDHYTDGRYAPGKDGDNPLAEIYEGGKNKSHLNQLSARVALHYKPVKGLTLTAQLAPILDFDKVKDYSKKIEYTDINDPARIIAQNRARTSLNESRTENYAINTQLLANYNLTVDDDHNFDVLAGFEENYRHYEGLGASRQGFALLGFPYLNAGAIDLRDNSGSANESALHSFFGRLQYNYKSRYYLQSNIRADRSSRFAPAHRQAVYPSVSGGWVLTEENFLKDNSVVNFLKLRASWGRSGNERLRDRNDSDSYYPYQAQIDFTNALFYQNGKIVPLPGGGQQVYAVENISWETSQTTDFGMDMSFFDSRLSVSADYYNKKTYDILLPLDIPLYLGYDKPNQNAGELGVKGWEVELGWADKIGDLKYSAALNVADAKSKIYNLKGTEFLGDQIIRQGSEYNEWFGYQYDGIFQTIEELTGAPVLNANTKVGDHRYIDVNQDGKITPDDKVLLGGALPRFQYGGNIRLDYKNFDFGLVFQGVGKKLSRLNSEVIQPFAEGFGSFPEELVGKFWSSNNTAEQNEKAIYPRLSRVSNSNNYVLSNHWLIDGSYFRIKNLTLGYTVKHNLMNKVGIKSVRVHAAVNDLFSKSKFPKYLDPEAANYAYPITRTFLFGASLRF
ncbi:SusC/RagA family TonB-linked outer membrane protein [Sphingobacterium anhuiense]|uniref:SusC/RagA family TonB-linked outer membrane protein n=1 Tax=Sphingobacterium anhuiense TaxID=493780 RepID=A0ABW5YWY3_9SPHI